MELQEAINVFLESYENEQTRHSFDDSLKGMVHFLGVAHDVDLIEPIELQRYINKLRQRKNQHNPEKTLSPVTVNKHIKSIKRFFNWLVQQEILVASPARNLQIRNVSIKTQAKAARQDEIAQLKIAAADTRNSVRNYAVVMLAIDSGARRGGLATLTLDNLFIDELKATVYEKGDTSYTVFFEEDTAAALDAWLKSRKLCRHNFVFHTIRPPYDPMSASAISQMIRRLNIKAGNRSLATHALRHAKGIELSQQGVPPTIIQHTLNHKNITTTLKHYANLDDPEVIEAYNREALRKSRQRENIILFPRVPKDGNKKTPPDTAR